MKIYKIIIPCILLICGTLGINAQHGNLGVDMYSFFDNSEGNDAYRSTLTHAGLRFTPKLQLCTNDSLHHIVGGYNFLYEYGESELSKGAIEVYYRYQSDNLRILLGSFPRALMHEEMPEYLICDSIRYFRPEMAGFDFLYMNEHGHLEVFVDWIQKRSTTEREQFMAGLATRWHWNRWQVGLEGYLYHYALETYGQELGHSIHEVATAHPYVGMLLGSEECRLNADLRLGMLIQMDRDRADMKWHSPVGFIADADINWRRFHLHETFYAGKSQQYFGNAGFGRYYWGDTFTQSPWYSRTDLGYNIIVHKNVSLGANLTFNFTDKGMQWHQMLTFKCNILAPSHPHFKK